MNVTTVNKHLPQNLRAQRGKRGHIKVKAAGLEYQFDKSKFGSSEEMAAYAASKIPRSPAGIVN